MYNGNTVVQHLELKTVKLACSWAMPVHKATPSSPLELYLPKSWTSVPERCRCAGVPDEVEFATSPQLARKMLQQAFDAEVPAAWVTADEVYGSDRSLRLWLEEQPTCLT